MYQISKNDMGVCGWDSRRVMMTEVLLPRKITRCIIKHIRKRNFCQFLGTQKDLSV